MSGQPCTEALVWQVGKAAGTHESSPCEAYSLCKLISTVLWHLGGLGVGWGEHQKGRGKGGGEGNGRVGRGLRIEGG